MNRNVLSVRQSINLVPMLFSSLATPSEGKSLGTRLSTVVVNQSPAISP